MKHQLFQTLIFAGLFLFATGTASGWQDARDLSKTGKSCTQENPQQKKDASAMTVYTCSMHPEVLQESTGKCPKCGMKLTAMEVKGDLFTCSMHPEILSLKAGKCTKCGMNLTAKNTAKKPLPKKK